MGKIAKTTRRATKLRSARLDLLEVFCGEKSRLSMAVGKLGGVAVRVSIVKSGASGDPPPKLKGVKSGSVVTWRLALTRPEDQVALLAFCKARRPRFLMTSPPCKYFSVLSNSMGRGIRRKSPPGVDRKWRAGYAEAQTLLQVCKQAHAIQAALKGVSVHEQPPRAKMYKAPPVAREPKHAMGFPEWPSALDAKRECYRKMTVNGCQVGLKHPKLKMPMKKGWEFEIAGPESGALASALCDLRCKNKCSHATTIDNGSVTSFAESYPWPLANIFARHIVS